MSDIVQVLRMVLYEGEREWVETTVRKSVHGTKVLLKGSITAVTVTEFPIKVADKLRRPPYLREEYEEDEHPPR